MDLIGLVISLISGAAGGIGAARVLKQYDMGMVWNSLAGIVGGVLGTYLLGLAGLNPGAAGDVSVASVVSQILSGGIGGGVLLVVASYVKQMVAKA